MSLDFLDIARRPPRAHVLGWLALAIAAGMTFDGACEFISAREILEAAQQRAKRTSDGGTTAGQDVTRSAGGVPPATFQRSGWPTLFKALESAALASGRKASLSSVDAPRPRSAKMEVILSGTIADREALFDYVRSLSEAVGVEDARLESQQASEERDAPEKFRAVLVIAPGRTP